MNKVIIALLVFTTLVVLFNKHAYSEDTLEFSSGKEKVQLIELYSSQGCSSCPPAENWLNKFEDDKRLWKEIVPLGFHVDYWDRLGWKDPFGSREYTLRQYAHRKENNVGSVYTPGFVVDGSEWRGWFKGKTLPDNNDNAGILSAKITEGKLQVDYSQKISKLELNYAILGFDLETKVTRGENSGKTLTHDFVVLSHNRSTSGDGSWEVKLPQTSLLAKTGKYAIAVWINKPETLKPIQAAGSWLETKPVKTVEN